MIPDDILKNLLSEEDYQLLKDSQAKVDEMNQDPEKIKSYADEIIGKLEQLSPEQMKEVYTKNVLNIALMVASIHSERNNLVLFHDMILKLFFFGVAVGVNLDTDAWDNFKKNAES